MNYSRHRLKQKMEKIKDLSGKQREEAEQKFLNEPEPSDVDTQPEPEPETETDEILEEAPQPVRRRGRPRAN